MKEQGRAAAVDALGQGNGTARPIENKGELAVLYCFVFLFIAAHGAGIWSIDNLIRGRRPVVTTA